MRGHGTDPVVSPGGPLGVFPGVHRVLDVPAPVAGAEWSFTVPSLGWLRIRSIVATLTTSAVVANRVAGFTLSDPDRVAYAASSNLALPASSAQRIVYMPGTGSGGLVGAGGTLLVPLPDLIVPVGYVLKSFTGLIDVADQYSNVRMIVEEFDTHPAGFPFGRTDQYDNRYGADQQAPKEIR